MSDIDRSEVIEYAKEKRHELIEFWEDYKHENREVKYYDFIINSLETDEAYQLAYERTTKNDLAVDCIPRVKVIDYLCKHCPDDGECFKDCDEIKHLRKMSSVTPQDPRWIPVSNGLPKDYQRVLVTVVNYDGHKVVRAAEYRGLRRIFQITENHEQWKVGEKGLLAWMPLPKHYEPQKSEDKE